MPEKKPLLPKDLQYHFDHKKPGLSAQKSLRKYISRKCQWRETHQGIIPCASFIYFGDAKIPHEIYDMWVERGETGKEEKILAKYTEHNGQVDLNHYWEHYEPQGDFNYFHLDKRTAFRKKRRLEGSLTTSTFIHYGSHEFSRTRKPDEYKEFLLNSPN